MVQKKTKVKTVKKNTVNKVKTDEKKPKKSFLNA